MGRLAGAIYAKPEFVWHASAIHVESEIQWHTAETGRYMSTWGRTDPDKSGVLRSARYLRDVQYVMELDLHVTPARSPGGVRHHGVERTREQGEDGRSTDAHLSYRTEALRRFRAGGWYTTPYLGRRCCPISDFELLEPDDVVTPIHKTMDLGPMLLEMVPGLDGSMSPVLFDAFLVDGTLRMPTARWKAEVLPKIWAARNSKGRWRK